MSKEHTLTCSAGSGALPLPQGGQDSERSSSASETPFAGVSCGSTGRKSRACRTSTTLTGENGQGQLFSPEAFPANRSALADGGAEPPTSVRSGLKCAELLMKPNQAGCLVKMLLASSRWNSTACCLTWRPSATPRGRLLFRLVPWTPDTDETEFGLWPTPKATAAGADFAKLERSKTGISLQTAVRIWPTPMAANPGSRPNGKGGKILAEEVQIEEGIRQRGVKMYPTMDVGAAKGRGQASADARSRLGGSLNPNWVEWLMGYPIGHTACEDSETPSSRKSRK